MGKRKSRVVLGPATQFGPQPGREHVPNGAPNPLSCRARRSTCSRLDIDQSCKRQRSVRGLSEGRSNIPHVVVNSGATADGGLPISEEVIGQPDARAEVVHELFWMTGPRVNGSVKSLTCLDCLPVQLVRSVHEFVAQAQVYGQPLRLPASHPGRRSHRC